MQQNGQEQTSEQPEQEGEMNTANASEQAEQQPAEERQETEECLDLLRRTQADYVNYRRRVNQEIADARIAAQSTLLSQLLPVLDDLGRGLSTAPSELASHPWVQGLSLIERRLTTLLNQLGVRRIGAPGELFNPRWHEAIATEERADVSEGTILQVTRPGYVMGERVIRPAQVVVARAPSHTSHAKAHHGDAPAH